ncbi:MAG: sigma-54 dependent transcriptional regulator [Terracidiphilus sp.]
MSNRILIVEHPQSTPHCGGEQAVVAQEWKNARRALWHSFSPEDLRAMKDCLLIACAVPCDSKVAAFFQWLRSNPVSVPIFAILPADNGDLLRLATETVDDFLLWPIRPEELRTRVARLLGPGTQALTDIQATLAAEIGLGQLVGRDPAFLSALAQISIFGACDAPVLLTGETGTGKELCARVTHLLSKRHRGPFIPVDCGALPDHLFENELFGHSRGAFTDARSDQKGLVSLAHGGTLFLDEIDSLSLPAQSKLLRLLQERVYRPLGSEVFKQAEVRIIAATNRNLEDLVKQKTFRSDLFFRINVLRIHLPALRERRSDIALLCRHFIDEICKTNDLPRKVLSPAAASKLEQYPWPGNVRELYNSMQRAVLSSPGTQIAAAVFPLNLSDDDAEPGIGDAACLGFRSAKLHAIQHFEREYVKQMMEKHNGNVTQAAREACKDRRAFGRLAQKYRILGASE